MAARAQLSNGASVQSTWIAKRWATHYLAQSSKIPRKVATSELTIRHFFTIVDDMGKREYLGEFELTVILALLRVGEDAYGVPIAREIEASTAARWESPASMRPWSG